MIASNKLHLWSAFFKGRKLAFIICFGLLVIHFCPLYVIGQGTQYSFQLGGNASEELHHNLVDAAGNNYHTLNFSGTMDANPGPGVTTIVGDAAGRGFLLKLDNAGNLVWVKKVPCSWLTDIEFDPQGNLIMVGSFTGTRDFDLGPGVFNLSATHIRAAFVLKLDPNGNFIWATKIDGSTNISASSVTSIPSGSIYFSGSFDDTLFHFSTGLPQFIDDFQLDDGFLCKVSSVGAIQWVRHYRCNDFGSGADMVGDANGHIYAAVDAYGSRSINPGPPYVNHSMSGSLGDEALTKLDSNGIMVDYVLFGDSMGVYREPDALRLLPNGNILLGLYFGSGIQFPSWLPITSQGQWGSGVLVELDPQLDLVWYGQYHGTGLAVIHSIEIDPAGNRIVAGTVTRGTVDLDFGPGSAIVTGPPPGVYENHGFLAKYSPSMQLIYGKKFDQTGNINLEAGIDAFGSIYLSGNFNLTLDGDIFAPVNTLNSGGSNADLFFIKIAGACTTSVFSSISHTNCGSYNWNGQMLTNSGIYSDTLVSGSGCDSIVTLNLTVNQSSSSTQSATVCSSYTWPTNGQTYSASGTYTALLPNSTGCDSIVTLNLTVNQPSSSTQSATACSSYTWPTNGQTYTAAGTYTALLSNNAGCDSIVTLNLTVNQPSSSTQSATACSSYTWPTNGQTYTAAGSYTALLTNAAGCDSIVTLNLTVDNVNAGVTQSGQVLTANGMGSYQWVDCNNGFSPVAGATGAQFVPVQSGIYAVVVSQGVCTDTSACYAVIGTSLAAPIGKEGAFTLFPNPAADVVHVVWTEDASGACDWEVWSALGEKVLSVPVVVQQGENELAIPVSGLPSANYWVVYRTPKAIVVQSLAVHR